MPSNSQPIEKVVHDDKGILEVHSVFRTIQGEGPLAGMPAVFVRLAGCVLQCPACDTDYTSGRVRYDPTSLANLVDFYAEHGSQDCKGRNTYRTKLVVLTGGEPFRQNVVPFIDTALRRGYEVQVETNGVLCPSNLPWFHLNFAVVVSPKNEHVHPLLLDATVSWKYILDAKEVDEKDGLPTRTMLGARPFRPPAMFGVDRIFVQPLDEKDPVANKNNYDAAVKSCLRFGYRLSVQLQKIVGIE